jgi:hypothetical protein
MRGAGDIGALRDAFATEKLSAFHSLQTFSANRGPCRLRAMRRNRGRLVHATMTTFKHPSFQDRVGQAADAKKRALEQLRLRPEPDEKKLAERKAADARRQALQAERSVAKKAATEAAAQSKAQAAAEAAPSVPTEAKRKAARDARYAARKARR